MKQNQEIEAADLLRLETWRRLVPERLFLQKVREGFMYPTRAEDKSMFPHSITKSHAPGSLAKRTPEQSQGELTRCCVPLRSLDRDQQNVRGVCSCHFKVPSLIHN